MDAYIPTTSDPEVVMSSSGDEYINSLKIEETEDQLMEEIFPTHNLPEATPDHRMP